MTAKRLIKLRQILEKHQLDAVLIGSPESRFYLSGFTGTAGHLLIGQEKAYLITDFRYTEQAALEAPLFEVVRFPGSPQETAATLIQDLAWQKIGFEAQKMSFEEHKNFQQALQAKLTPLTEEISGLRAIKDEEELKIMTAGAKKTDRAFKWILENIKAGMTEKEFSRELEIYLLKEGASRPSFSFIVASGARGALPHGVASDKIMHKSDLVTIDFGAVFAGYSTDMTRTVALGEPDALLKEIYNVVLKAQEAACRAIRPGIKGREADSVARDIIASAGFGENFGHGLGHGVGLEVHEYPRLNTKSESVLEPGMVVTVEPGIYLPGLGGVRIEDMVLVRDEGAELLTKSPKELIIL